MTEAVKVGTSNDCPVWLEHDVRQTHMHVLGLSRTGKSKFLEHLIREDILAGHGVCLIDPHGQLYDEVTAWLAANELHRTEKLHLLNPSDDAWSVGFNPLAHHGRMEPSVLIDAMVDACVKVWGGGDVSQTPRLSRALQVIFGALAANNLTLAEWQLFANWSTRAFRDDLLRQIDNSSIAQEWDEIQNGLTQRQFSEFFESTRNRLLEFTKAHAIRDMVGRTEQVIDFKRCMDEGHIVLVNLKPSARLSPRNGQLLGALITNSLYANAFVRSATDAVRNPFYCYIDECGQFVTDDVANALDETAKYGLHMVLSHQRLDQLAAQSEHLLNAVWAGAQVKVVFNCDDEKMAEPLARHLFRKSVDIERVKDRITQPVVIGYEQITLRGESVSHSHGKSVGETSFSGASLNAITGAVSMYDVDGNEIGASASFVDGQGETSGLGRSSTYSEMTALGESTHEALRPVLEERSLTPMPLEEQFHEGLVAIRSLPPRHAYLYHRNIGTIPFITPKVRAATTFADEQPEFSKTANMRSEFTSRVQEVRAQSAKRVAALGMGEADQDDDEEYFN